MCEFDGMHRPQTVGPTSDFGKVIKNLEGLTGFGASFETQVHTFQNVFVVWWDISFLKKMEPT